MHSEEFDRVNKLAADNIERLLANFKIEPLKLHRSNYLVGKCFLVDGADNPRGFCIYDHPSRGFPAGFKSWSHPEVEKTGTSMVNLIRLLLERDKGKNVPVSEAISFIKRISREKVAF
jgi:hypothetical protein